MEESLNRFQSYRSRPQRLDRAAKTNYIVDATSNGDRWVLDPKVCPARQSACRPASCISLTDPINCNLRKHA